MKFKTQPLRGILITQVFGNVHPQYGKHLGVDFGAPLGSNLYAVCDMKFLGLSSDAQKGFGLSFVVDEPTVSYKILYWHLGSWNPLIPIMHRYLTEGIKEGEMFALSGNTGYSTGPHLHFEVWRGRKLNNGYYEWIEPVDPLSFVEGWNDSKHCPSSNLIYRGIIPRLVGILQGR